MTYIFKKKIERDAVEQTYEKPSLKSETWCKGGSVDNIYTKRKKPDSEKLLCTMGEYRGCWRNTCWMALTYSHPSKNIRKVLLKPMPTFGWLRHVLTILQTHQCIFSYTNRLKYVALNNRFSSIIKLTSVGREHTTKKKKNRVTFWKRTKYLL